ncbi:MAG: MFS transporter [Jatrophihabitans sp.]|uniref:MFS transporter n=1 Tax=Jatrophihabitans sp. TaxID=1932789 RepID=UPI0039115C8F
MSDTRRWAALWVIALAQFMVIMDTSIIGVALPKMRVDLGFTAESLQWVFNAYVVVLGGLLLLGGRLSDLFGARRMFATGWAVLLAGSVVSAVADSVSVELVGRAAQGAGSALIAPAALTLLMTLFGGTSDLPKAIALYGAAAPAGGTAGVFLGGVITEWLSWPWIFWLYVPISIAALIATPLLMPQPSGRRGSLDLLGAVTVTAGLTLAVLGVVRAPQIGWDSGTTLLTLAGAVLLIAAFLGLEATLRNPLIRLKIFRTPLLGAANLAQILLGAAWVPMWYFLNLYLQQVLGYGAFASGAALLPMTVLIMVLMVAVAPRLIVRFGPKPLIVAGLVALSAGLLWLSFVRPTGNFAVDVLPASLVAALGQALAFIPSLGTALSSARPEEGGLAAGIVNTAYQIGSALGLAAMTAVAAAHGATHFGNRPDLTDGYSAAFTGAASIAVAGAVLVAALFRTRSGPGTAAPADQHRTQPLTVIDV